MRGVAIRQLQAFARELVEVRCLHVLRAKAMQVAVAEIIGEDEDDVGLCGVSGTNYYQQESEETFHGEDTERIGPALPCKIRVTS